MSTRCMISIKRTIVRFLAVGTAVLATGCSTVAQRTATAAPCPPTRTLVCEPFGAEDRCDCRDRTRVGRELDRLGYMAPGLGTW
jgi:hypothetical protein